MKLRIISMLALILASAMPTVAQEKPAESAPKLVLATPKHYFGEVKPGTPLNHSFVLKNEGTSDLQVLSVAPGCGCTTTDYDRVIPPGKEGKITLAIENTQGYVGAMSKSAMVTTNDPASKSLTLILSASFKPVEGTVQPTGFAVPAEKRVGPFAVQPNTIWVTDVFSGDTASGTIAFINRENQPVHVKKVAAGGSAFNVQLQTLEEGQRYNVVVSTTPSLKVGEHAQTATLYTDSRATPEIPLQLEVTVRPRVFATPTSLNLPGLQLGVPSAELSLGTIYVQKVGASGLRIDEVVSTLPFIQTEVKQQADGQFYAIRVVVDKSRVTPGSKFKGTIRVRTNDDATRVIRIPVQGSFS
ncbi:MAG: DUF1573 domain-containing protein [Acidobacteria bacterium]|nr:DUF1573 domain-containing protein [Acidobacteriota bacterium]